MKKRYSVLFAALAVILLATTFVHAAVPHLIRFQGKVTDKAGGPLNGSYNITFRVYDAVTGGTLKWSETQSAIPVNNGIFTVLLGNATQPNGMDLPFSAPYWLSMEVNSDGEMAPRQQLSSVGYAIHAETAENFLGGSAGLVPAGAIILWTGANCPEGYERVGELDGKFIAGAKTNELPNFNAGGSNTHNHSGATGSAGNHSHSVSGSTSQADAPSGASGGDGQFARYQHTHSFSGSTDPVGAHTHTLNDVDNRPIFATVLFCRKKP